MKRRSVHAIGYIMLSLAIFFIWTTLAKTEKVYRPEVLRLPLLDPIQGTEGVAQAPFIASGPSLVQSIEGKAPTPFVKRRLLPDTAWALSRIVPASVWDFLVQILEGPSRLQRSIRFYLGSVLWWKPENYPYLFSGYFLIWLSTLGFLYQAKELTRNLYDVSEAGASLCGALIGIALLGGNGIWDDYPYDIPNAFVFALALNGLLRERWWFIPAFAAAAYSKETSILLILSYLLIRFEQMNKLKYRLIITLLLILFIIIRQWLNFRYAQHHSANHWYPGRNLNVLAKGVIQFMWVWWIVFFAIARMFCMLGDLPRVLRRLVVPLLGTMLALCFLYGWIDERRAYYEVLPIAGLVVLQWSVTEIGLAHLLTPRDQAARFEGPGSPSASNYGAFETMPVPRSPSEVTAMLNRLYPQTGGLPRLLIQLRPWICPFEEVLTRIPPRTGDLLDVGCGIGLASALTAGSGLATRVEGFDTSDRVIAFARTALSSVPPDRRPFLYALPEDRWPTGQFDVVLCIDVLHHVPPEHQREFCSRLCRTVRPGASLILKDLAPDPRWKAWANQLHDAIMTRQRVHYRTPDEVANWLRAEGLIVEESTSMHRLWYAHYLIVAVSAR